MDLSIDLRSSLPESGVGLVLSAREAFIRSDETGEILGVGRIVEVFVIVDSDDAGNRR